MSTVRAAKKPRAREWTVADLQRRFGPIPFGRIRQHPAPGTATEDDVLWLNDHEDRLYELVDGILVEKTVGLEESWIAAILITLMNSHVRPRNLGFVTGADGMYRLTMGKVRIPDVAYVSWKRLPDGRFPEEPIPDLVPDLAVEVISTSNTRKEMDEKLKDYFERGVRLVWFVRPRSRTIDVYTSADSFKRLDGFGDARRRRGVARFRGTGRRPVPDAGSSESGENEREAAQALILSHFDHDAEFMPAMPETAPRYRLVIFDAIDDPQELREMICRLTGMHPTDVVQWLARRPGVWPHPLDEPTVRGLLDGLYEAGVAAEAWRADQFPDLSPPRTVHRAACLDEGLRIEGLRGEPTHWVPWDRVEMICAGKITAVDEVRDVQKPRWPSDGHLRDPGSGPATTPPDRTDCQGTSNSAGSGRRGPDRSPRPPHRLPRGREPDELRVSGQPTAELGCRELPRSSSPTCVSGRGRPI